IFYFFFSSRRRHTRFSRDWSSDVCSSDLTNVHIDHFVSVDFVGFKEMVDALGGVTMCIPEPIQDEKAGHLNLEAGEQTLDGEEALGYVRSRKGQGDGSDLSRIDRQQDFMGARLQEG